MKITKKILSLLLAAAMTASSLPVFAEDFVGENLKTEVDSEIITSNESYDTADENDSENEPEVEMEVSETPTEITEEKADDTDAELYSLLPLEEVNAKLELKGYLPIEMSDIPVSEVLSNLTNAETGEKINIDTDEVTVWSSGQKSGSDVVNKEAWSIFDMDDAMNLSGYWNADDSFQIIVGSGNQLDADNIRYIVSMEKNNYEPMFDMELYMQDASDERINIPFDYDNESFDEIYEKYNKTNRTVEYNLEAASFFGKDSEFYAGMKYHIPDEYDNEIVELQKTVDIRVYKGGYDTVKDIETAKRKNPDIDVTKTMWNVNLSKKNTGDIVTCGGENIFTAVAYRGSAVTGIQKISIKIPCRTERMYDYSLYLQGDKKERVNTGAKLSYTYPNEKTGIETYTFTLRSYYTDAASFYMGMSFYDYLIEKYKETYPDIEKQLTAKVYKGIYNTVKAAQKEEDGENDITSVIMNKDMNDVNAGYYFNYGDNNFTVVSYYRGNVVGIRKINVKLKSEVHKKQLYDFNLYTQDGERKKIDDVYCYNSYNADTNNNSIGKTIKETYKVYVPSYYNKTSVYYMELLPCDDYGYDDYELTANIYKGQYNTLKAIEKNKAVDVTNQIFKQDMSMNNAGYKLGDKEQFFTAVNKINGAIVGICTFSVKITPRNSYLEYSLYHQNEDGSREDVYLEEKDVTDDDIKKNKSTIIVPSLYDTDSELYLGINVDEEEIKNGMTVSVYDGTYSINSIKSAVNKNPSIDITSAILNKTMSDKDAGWKTKLNNKALTVAYKNNEQITAVKNIILSVEPAKNIVSFDKLHIKNGENYINIYSKEDDVNGVKTTTFKINRDKYDINDNAEYYTNIEIEDGYDLTEDDNENIVKIVSGHYSSMNAAKDAENIKDKILMSEGSQGYKIDYGAKGVQDFTVFAGKDGKEVHKLRIIIELTDETYVGPTPSPEIPKGSADKDFNVVGVKSGDKIFDTYIIPYVHDTYYYQNHYQTLFINDENVDIKSLQPIVNISKNAKVTYWEDEQTQEDEVIDYSTIEDEEKNAEHTLAARDFTKTVRYHIQPENSSSASEYWVTFAKKTPKAQLFVNGPDERRVFIKKRSSNEYTQGEYHDIFIANLGGEELQDINVKLTNAKNIELDKYWTIGSKENNTLAPFTTTKKEEDKQYGELPNVGKIRLIAAGDGNISGTLTITAKGQKRQVIKITGKAGDPEIVTNKINEGVKYVPYSSKLVTDNAYDWNTVTFSTDRGNSFTDRKTGKEIYEYDNLPEGLTIIPRSGEIYGVPREFGTFEICVAATFSYTGNTSEKVYTLNIKENTDVNVNAQVDEGYSIETTVKDMLVAEDQVFEIEGELSEFKNFWLDGQKLIKDVDYTAEKGSTKITVQAQTFDNAGEGKHTIAGEFRVNGDDNNELKKASQNYQLGETKTPVHTPDNSNRGGGGGSHSKSTPTPTNTPLPNLENLVPLIKLTFETNGGTEAEPIYALVSGTTKLPATTKAGYEFDGWYKDAALTQKYEEGEVLDGVSVLYAKWIDQSAVTNDTQSLELFNDVNIYDWYYSEVEWAYKSGLMIGTGDKLFEPNAIVTQGMVATVLARLAGIDANVYNGVVFTDVPENEWYSSYAKWAKIEKIMDHLVFDPNAALAREDMCIIIKKFFDYVNAAYTVSEDNIVFEDEALIADEAKAAVQVLYKIGILNGRSEKVIAPDEFTTRAEFAAFIHRTDVFIQEHK